MCVQKRCSIMRLSIILTVYNKEQFLLRSFEALLSQDIVDEGQYEILVVNDGSTDGSLAICEEYAKKDERVRVIKQDNQGLSMARNNGMDAAKGEYVWFVDADDRISTRAVRLICEAAESKPDIIPIYGETEGINKVRNMVSPDAKNGKEILLGGRWEQCGVFNIFGKSFLKENDLSFMPGIYHEDAEFTPRMLYAAKSVRVVPEVLYTVYREANSIMTTPRAKRAFDCMTVAERLSCFVVENDEEKTEIGKVIDGCVSQMVNNGFFVIVQNSKKEQKKLGEVFYAKRVHLLRSLGNAPKQKYRIESKLFALLPKYSVSIYKLMKKFG